MTNDQARHLAALASDDAFMASMRAYSAEQAALCGEQMRLSVKSGNHEDSIRFEAQMTTWEELPESLQMHVDKFRSNTGR